MYIFFQNLPTMNILDPIFLSHIVSKFVASELPEYCNSPIWWVHIKLNNYN
jgi:hypothetical protein